MTDSRIIVKSVWNRPFQESMEWYEKQVRVTTIFPPSGPVIRYFPDLVFSSASYGI